MREQADILLIGAGIAGCSIAAHVLRLQPEIRVMLLDGAHVGAGSTSRSMAAFRHQWSVPAHVAFSLYSAREYDAMAQRGVPIGFRRQGYLFLHDREETWREAARHAFDQSEAGAEGVRTLSVAELTTGVSCGAEIEDDAVVGAIFGARDGWLDPLAAAQAYLDEARAAGLDYRPGTAVTGLHTERGRLSAVVCADGLVVTAGRTVLCAGPWSAPLAAMADLDLPIRPAKRYLYQTRPIAGVDVEGWPMVIAPGGAHCRPAEGNTLILGWEERPVPLDQTPGAESLWEEQDQVEPGFGTPVPGSI